MAQNNSKSKTANGDKAVAVSTTTRENIRWIAGFVMLAVGVFILCSIFSYLFYWQSDMSALMERSNPMAKPRFSNMCGEMGASVANALVGGGFGIFALVIPIIIIIIGWRLFRYKPLKLNHFALSLLLVLLLGSLTLAATFGTAWNLFGSGLGGSYGLAMCASLKGFVGNLGIFIIIVAGWILTGLFINRNFLQVVDNAGEHVADGVSGAAKWVWGKVCTSKEARDDAKEVSKVAEPAVNEVPKEFEIVVEERTETQTEERSEKHAEVVVAEEHHTEESAEDEDFSALSGEDDTEEEEVEPRIMSVGRDAVVMVGEGGRIIVKESDPAQPVDDYPFKEPDAPLEEMPAEVVMAPMEVASVLGMDKAEEEDGLVVTVEQGVSREVDADDIISELYDPMRDLHSYEAPSPSLLVDHKSKAVIDDEEIYQNKERIRETLLNFGIPIRSMHATVGPTVTLYEIVQEQGVKISKIQGLENDIAQSLKAMAVRIIAPIPGRGTVGIEVPNLTKQIVSMHSAICSEEFQTSKAELPVVIGRTIQNENYTFDLAKMPHLLVAGATGQGKSVGLNAIITSLLYRKHPAELKFVLVDPKMVEFSLYSKLEKHFLAKMESEDEAIVTDPKKAVYTLNALCTEMANRLELCKKAAAKNIVEYNDKFLKRRLNPENGHRFLPYIVVVIDEFADLIMTAKEVEAPVMRLAQKARAIGIHLIVATQRPDVRVITGGIKANFPARIAFRVMQMTDSRTIIDQPGANQLIGRGDMLLSNGGEITRIQCAFVDTPEVENIVEHIAAQQGYTSAYNLPDYTPESSGGEGMPSFGSEESSAPQKYDPKFGEIAREAVTSGIISTSMIQRNFEVGFNRAGRIMLQLERAGIVGPQIGSKPREIKYYDLPSLEARLQELGIF